MSVGEDALMRSTLQSNGMRIVECTIVFPFFSCECRQFGQVYSSLHFIITTSHDQFTVIMIIKVECTFTKSNGNQFRQVYSSFPLQSVHSQIPRENTHGMHDHQTEVISNWASLFIISFFQNHSSIPMNEQRKNSYYLHSFLPFQSLPKKAHS